MQIEDIINLFETSHLMSYVALFFIFNISIITIEIIVDIIAKKQRRWKDTIANIAIYFLGKITDNLLLGSLGIIALLPIYYLIPYEIPMNWWTWVLGILAADFTYYWMHRIEHEHRILWASHSVHHSSEDYNLTVSFRLSIIEGIFEWMFLIPMILIGFNPFQAIVSLIFVAQFQTWIHTEKIQKLGWLDEVFNTPSVHRVHHGSNNKYLDKNYGGLLMIWDKIFGTFQREEEKVIYGLTQNIKTNNPITINFIEYKNIWNEVKQCRTLKHKLKIIFGNLIWKPNYFKK
ncbi:MAG: sterol desaturase family protein [Flavobacteriaceae bacterium]|nr:sterol desaturase family protein [Flavobacteriaceae bacterium]